MPAIKHVHKYYRTKLNYVNVWACAHSDCTHYMPKHLEPMIGNKKSICWDCDAEMHLGPNQLEMDKPICDACNGTTQIEEVDLSPDLIERLKTKGLM